MGLFDFFKKKTEDVSQGVQDATQNVNIDEFKSQAGDTMNNVADKAGDVANNVADQASNVTDKIPGQWDDQLVDKAKEVKDNLTQNDQNQQ